MNKTRFLKLLKKGIKRIPLMTIEELLELGSIIDSIKNSIPQSEKSETIHSGDDYEVTREEKLSPRPLHLIITKLNCFIRAQITHQTFLQDKHSKGEYTKRIIDISVSSIKEELYGEIIKKFMDAFCLPHEERTPALYRLFTEINQHVSKNGGEHIIFRSNK